MHTLTFKASDEILAKLEKQAVVQDRSKSYIIRKAVEAYFKKLEEDEARATIRMQDEPFDADHLMLVESH